jgi:hypothetical protein
MVSSFAMMHAGVIRHSMPSNALRVASFPKKMRNAPLQISAFLRLPGTR